MNKKKIISINIIFIVLTFISFLGSSFLLSKNNKNNYINSLNNYISIIDNLYDESDESISKIDSSFSLFDSYRITLISYKDGKVIYDNNLNYNKEENRLEEFIEHQNGNPYYKISLTTNKNNLYVVKRSKNSLNFIRVGVDAELISDYNHLVILIGSIILLIIDISFILISYFLFKKEFNNIKDEIKNINSLLKTDSIIDNDSLKITLNNTYLVLKNNLNELEEEKRRNKFILDNIKQGFVILDNNLNIIKMNEYSLKIFDIKDNYLNKNILYFDNGCEIENELNNFNEDIKIFEIPINDKYYEFLASKIILNNNSSLISLIIFDISKEKEIEISKKEFFQNASHELKSPLTSIIGYEELINKKIITNQEEINKINEKILNESLRMKNIVLDMLSLASLESKINKNKELLNLKDFILEIESRYDLKLKEKNITLINDLNDYYLNINKEDINKLINNVFINSINYNKNNGSIIITLKNNYLSIKDSGIGISNNDQKYIFNRFYRVDKARSKESSGTGLGLAIVKHICINNNIEIKLISELDKGSEFIFTFNN